MGQRKLVLVSQQFLLRHALACLLLACSWPDAIEEYNCLGDYLVSENAFNPCTIIADAELPEAQLNELIRFAKKFNQKIVIIGSSHYEKRLVSLMKLKADGYLTMDSTAEDLIIKMHKIQQGTPIIDNCLIPAMVDELSGNSEEKAIVEKYNLLTAREKEVLKLLALGFSNSQIASELVISINTVKNHVHNVLDKLTIDNRTQLASYAYTMGLVS